MSRESNTPGDPVRRQCHLSLSLYNDRLLLTLGIVHNYVPRAPLTPGLSIGAVTDDTAIAAHRIKRLEVNGMSPRIVRSEFEEHRHVTVGVSDELLHGCRPFVVEAVGLCGGPSEKHHFLLRGDCPHPIRKESLVSETPDDAKQDQADKNSDNDFECAFHFIV